MWKDLKIKNVDAIEKVVAEYFVWMQDILPYGKMKIRIVEQQDGTFDGSTDVSLIRKFDNMPECAVGSGSTIDEALEKTIQTFNEMVAEDYPKLDKLGLKPDEITYAEWSDF